MKVIIEYEVDNSLWGDEEDLQAMTDEELAELFAEDPIDMIHNATWRFE